MTYLRKEIAPGRRTKKAAALGSYPAGKGSTAMNKIVRIWLLIVAVINAPLIARAQGGCIDSPENPTAVLLAVGAAAYAWPSIRRKLRGSGNSRTR